MSNARPVPTRNNNRRSYIHPDLPQASFVFVRCDQVRRPLTPHYTGPYKVLERTEKYFVVDKAGKRDSISIDRLKPAYLESTNEHHNQSHTMPIPPIPSKSSIPNPTTSTSPVDHPKTTRFGHLVKFPKHFRGYNR